MVKGQYLMLSFLALNNIMVIQGGSSGLAYKLAMQWPASFCSTLSTKSARVQLAKLWPNLKASSTNREFWEREWKKHGSCSSLTIEQYFEKVIQLATLYNIYNILEKNSIKPSSKIHYTDKDISESIQKVTGYKPNVHSTKKEPF
nr:ribonuclease T2-like isoform X2 [Crassostrea virginica]